MSRQDRGGVRTAQDIERKYNLVGMKKAVRLQEEGLNKAQTLLDSFVNNSVKDEENIQAQVDGEITTWYANGEPTLANEPASYWTTDEAKEAHVGDLYYDRDTGHAYEFVLEEETYKWGAVTDSEVIESLAMSNSKSDTKDNQRRIFLVQPKPPYDNGDLWFDGEDIYICQISKASVNAETGEAEVYVEDDFIIATKYTDDTVANQVGEMLKVLEGTVLTVIESADQFKAEVYDLDYKTKAELDLVKECLRTLIKGSDGQSLMTQTENGWEFSIDGLMKTIDKAVADVERLEGDNENTINDLNNAKEALEVVTRVTSYMRFYDDNGEPTLELGTSANGFKSVHTNKGIQFMVGDTVQAYIDYNALNIERAIIHEELQVGGFLLKERANGNVGFVWRGEDE